MDTPASWKKAIVIRAFADNPDLAAAQWEIDIAQGGRQQAGLIPNPVASWDAEDTRRSTRTTTVKLSQTLELGGKRGARIEVASRDETAPSLCESAVSRTIRRKPSFSLSRRSR